MYSPAHPHQNSFLFTNSPRQSSSSHVRHRSLSFSNKLYPVTKYGHNRNNKISIRVRDNLQHLTTLLETNDPTIMSLSFTEQECGEDYIEENRLISVSNRSGKGYISDSSQNTKKYESFQILQEFLDKSGQPFQCINYYIKLLSLPQPNIKPDPLLYGTLFSSQIHPIITAYLQEKTQFYQMRACNQKILDIFYKYIFCEHGHIMQRNLHNPNFMNLGRWFYEEGLLNLFKKYYPDAQDFTLFFVKFLRHGLSALFVGAVNILQNKQINIIHQKSFLKSIKIAKVAYIDKYGII